METPSVFHESWTLRQLFKGLSPIPFPWERASGGARWLLAILLFSCVFVPRVTIGSVAGFYQVDLRTEDLLLGILGIITLGGIASQRFPREVPSVEKAFLWFLIAAQISILNGFPFL